MPRRHGETLTPSSGCRASSCSTKLLPSPEPRPPTRKVPSPASSHEHETSLDEPLPVAESRLRELQSRSTDQYRLPLGVQQDVGPEAPGSVAHVLPST